jgi:hypothetical protein
MCHHYKGGTWHIRTDDVAGKLAGDREDNWTNEHLTHGIEIILNDKVPHGLDMGFHVAPIHWLMCCKNFNSTTFDHETSLRAKELGRAGLASPPSH